MRITIRLVLFYVLGVFLIRAAASLHTGCYFTVAKLQCPCNYIWKLIKWHEQLAPKVA